jgi:hypothetical protein
MTHAKDARCPFLSNEFQHEVAAGTCCTIDLRPLIHVLAECGVPDLIRIVSGRLYADDAMNIHKDLIWLADAILPDVDLEKESRVVRQALRTDEVLRLSAAWYWHVGSLGYGVDVGMEM